MDIFAQPSYYGEGLIIRLQWDMLKEPIHTSFVDQDIDVPEGYQITSVKTTVLYTEQVVTDNLNRENEVMKDDVVNMTTYWVKWLDNVRTVGDRYYADQPLYSDWFDGPSPDCFSYSLEDTVNH